jgi:hypothetical protein
MGVLRGGLEPHPQRPGLVLIFAVPPFSLKIRCLAFRHIAIAGMVANARVGSHDDYYRTAAGCWWLPEPSTSSA